MAIKERDLIDVEAAKLLKLETKYAELGGSGKLYFMPHLSYVHVLISCKELPAIFLILTIHKS